VSITKCPQCRDPKGGEVRDSRQNPVGCYRRYYCKLCGFRYSSLEQVTKGRRPPTVIPGAEFNTAIQQAEDVLDQLRALQSVAVQMGEAES